MKCKHCGGEKFVAHQVCRMEILVDGEGDYIDGVHKDIGLDIYDSEPAYGPFQCCGCGAEYDVLVEGEESINGPIEGWTWKNDEAELNDHLKENQKVYYPIEAQINDCYKYLGVDKKDAYDMNEAEMDEASVDLRKYFEWVAHPGYHQLVPKSIETGFIIV